MIMLTTAMCDSDPRKDLTPLKQFKEKWVSLVLRVPETDLPGLPPQFPYTIVPF